MDNITDITIQRLVRELDAAALSGDVRRADELADILFRLQNGSAEDTVMPDGFLSALGSQAPKSIAGGSMKKSKSIKKLVTAAAAAALVIALGITAFATQLFGLRDLVFSGGTTAEAIVSPSETGGSPALTSAAPEPASTPPKQDLIGLQGYPDSQEYKATAAWNTFCAGYDTDHQILNKVGNGSNEYTEKYPMYLVYSKDMADKLASIVAEYGLKLHTAMLIADNADQLYGGAGTGRFLDSAGGGNKVLGGYVYNDGTFHYDGEAVLPGGVTVGYQLGNYVKGTFSDTYLNVGDASSYKEWQYKTAGGVTVSLALGSGKALVIADLPRSFVTVNVLAGASGAVTVETLQQFADSIDFSKISK